jgi:hypothetical protein
VSVFDITYTQIRIGARKCATAVRELEEDTFETAKGADGANNAFGQEPNIGELRCVRRGHKLKPVLLDAARRDEGSAGL